MEPLGEDHKDLVTRSIMGKKKEATTSFAGLGSGVRGP